VIRSSNLRLHFAGAAVAKLAPPLVQFLLLLLVARRATLDDVGRLALASAASFLCGALAELGFATTLSLPRPTFGTAEPPLRATGRLRVGAACCGTALYALLWAAGLGGHDPVLLLVTPLPFALALSSSYSGAMNASGLLRVEGAVSLVESIFILAIASIGSLLGSALTWCLVGLTVGRVGGTIARAALARRIPQSGVARLHGLARAQLPFALATVAVVFQGQVDMIAIGFFGSLAVAGVYGPLLRTAYGPILSAEAMSWSLYGDAFPDEHGDGRWIARHWRAVGIGSGIVLAVAFALLAEPFLRFLLRGPLPDLTLAVMLFALVIVARFVALVLNVDVLRAGRQRDEIPVLGVASLVLAVSGGLAAAAGSLTGLAGSRLASELIIVSGYAVIARRVLTRPRRALRAELPQEGRPLRLLFLTPFPPSLDGAHGGSRVIAQLLDRLAARHRVALMCLRRPDDLPVDERLRARLDLLVEVERPDARGSLRERVLHGFRARLLVLAGTPLWATELDVGLFRKRLLEVLREWRPDVVQVEYAAMGIYLREVGAAGTVAVLGEPDPPTSAALERGRRSERARLLQRLDLRAWRRFEHEVLSRVDAAVVFTARDVRALARLAGKTDVVRIPFGTDFAEREFASDVGDDGVLFVGNFVHPPNIDAADRLVRSIFPLVRERRPGSSLRIVGDNPPRRLREAAGDGVVVTGRVPDLIPYVERAAVVAAPIRLGGGMRVKVLEALAAGKAVVASSLAVEGLDVTDHDQLLVAETDEEFADGIARVLADRELRVRLGERARSWARENLTWDASIAAHEQLYARLLAAPTLAEPSRPPGPEACGPQPQLGQQFGEIS
jgi:glycosyltransferase involved in cell wall biosynthesis/O-antigen/teichoic acid export membrane protein